MCKGIHPPKNKVAPIAHTINMLIYSAKKNKANSIVLDKLYNDYLLSEFENDFYQLEIQM